MSNTYCLQDVSGDVVFVVADSPEDAVRAAQPGQYVVSVLDVLGTFILRTEPQVVRLSGPPRMEPKPTRPDGPAALSKP